MLSRPEKHDGLVKNIAVSGSFNGRFWNGSLLAQPNSTEFLDHFVSNIKEESKTEKSKPIDSLATTV